MPSPTLYRHQMVTSPKRSDAAWRGSNAKPRDDIGDAGVVEAGIADSVRAHLLIAPASSNVRCRPSRILVSNMPLFAWPAQSLKT